MTERDRRDPLRILVVAYKIEAGSGSEDASGYNITRALLRRGYDVTVVSRPNNIALLRDDPSFSRAGLVEVELPQPLQTIKRGGRGIILYYYLWQIAVGRRVARLRKTERFDVVHQLNFHADWAPHFLLNPGGLVVWGPIGHHPRIPSHFYAEGDRGEAAADAVRSLVKRAFWHLDPMLRRAIRRSDRILYANTDVASPFRAANRKIRVQPYAGGLDEPPASPGPSDEQLFRVVSVGRLVALKGFVPALRAFARFAHGVGLASTELVIVGDGRQRAALQRLSVELGIVQATRFVPWVDREALPSIYHSSSVFLFPSVEAQGLVVAEALSTGLPVVCTAGTGPALVAGDAGLTASSRSEEIHVAELASHLADLHEAWRNSRLAEFADHARRRHASHLAWESIAAAIGNDYEAALRYA